MPSPRTKTVSQDWAEAWLSANCQVLIACSGSHGVALFRLRFAGKKVYQALRQMRGAVCNLLQAAGGKDQMQVILLICGTLLAVQAAQHIIAIGIYRCATRGGTACQDQVQPGKGAEGLAAKMRDSNGQRLKPGEVFMLVVFSHFRHFASQVGGQLAQAGKVFADVDDGGHPPDFRARQMTSIVNIS